jgi:hypothetical protein
VQAAEIDLQGGQFYFRCGFRQRLGDLPQADGAVVVDAGFLGRLQVLFAASREKAGAQGQIVKTDGPDGPGGIALADGGVTRGVFAKQTPDGFLLEVELIHGHNSFILLQI